MVKSAKQKYEDTNAKSAIKKQTNKGLMYISSPKEILQIINKIPTGKVMTIAQIAAKLTKKHQVDFTCQLTAGIFISIIANYIEEEKLDTPYWRVVKGKGTLYDHYFRLPSHQAEKLENEGWQIVKKDKKQISAIKI
jgi:alkylated DNA nucleotide flippase Atl1